MIKIQQSAQSVNTFELECCMKDAWNIKNEFLSKTFEITLKEQSQNTRNYPDPEVDQLNLETVVQLQPALKNAINDDAAVEILEDQLKTKAEELKLNIENHHAFLNDAIEVKVESIRENLLDAEKSLVKQSDVEKEQLLSQLDLILEEKSVKNEIREKCRVLEAKIKQLECFGMNELFSENETFKIDIQSIGNISSKPSVHINSFHCDYIDFEFQPRDVLQLNKNRYVMSQKSLKCLILYDSKFNEIFRFSLDLPVISLTHNSKYIYAAQFDKFLKFDYDLNFFELKLYPDLEDEINHIEHICVYKDRIYASMNYELIEFSDMFDFIQIIQIKNVSRVFKFKILNDVACVSCCFDKEGAKTCFFRLPNFELIVSYDIVDPVIAAFGDRFSVYNGQYIWCYDTEGNETLFGHLDIGLPLSMSLADDDLTINLDRKKRIAKLKLNS